MKIEEIKDSKFLHNMSNRELRKLAADIRTFLLEKISKTGGHLSSNLGVVELTIALHQNFDFSKDKLFMDVGHQSYIHKILTGRAKDFDTLRKYHGLSGFQKRSESEYDHWEAGHAGTSLSGALGDQIAAYNDKNKHYTIALIGDGSIANGMSFEALNHIGSLQLPIIIVLNDNQMAISKQNSAFGRTLSRMRSSLAYQGLKVQVRKVLGSSKLGEATAIRLSHLKENIKNLVLTENYFDDLGLNYYGPVDGHNFRELSTAFKYAKQMSRPVVIHVRTVKGKGYSPSENDNNGIWHGVTAFSVDDGEIANDLPANYQPWSEAVADCLLDIAKKRSDLMVLTPAMIVGSSLEAFFKRYPTRSFDCGIAEEHAATLAAGLALAGKKPFLAIYSTFLQRAYDQINHDICRMDLPVIIGIDRAGLVGEDGDTHHGVFDIGILRPLPNLIIAQPKDYPELRSLLASAYECPHPFAIRYPRGVIEINKMSGKVEPVKIGTWEKTAVNNKPKIIIISYGVQVDLISEKLYSNDLSAIVVNARFIKPLDETMLKELAKTKLPLIVYESDMLSGGLGSAILEFFGDHKIKCEVTRYGLGDHYVAHGCISELRKQEKLDINSFIENISKICA